VSGLAAQHGKPTEAAIGFALLATTTSLQRMPVAATVEHLNLRIPQHVALLTRPLS